MAFCRKYIWLLLLVCIALPSVVHADGHGASTTTPSSHKPKDHIPTPKPTIGDTSGVQPDQCSIEGGGGCELSASGAINATAKSSSSDCPAVGHSGCYDGIRSPAGTAASAPVDVLASFGGGSPVLRCRYIDNSTIPAHDLFVGFKTPSEWGSFITNGTTGNPGLSLVNCSRPTLPSALKVYPSSDAAHIIAPTVRTPIPSSSPVYFTQEPFYYPCCSPAPTWSTTTLPPASQPTFTYNPPAPGASWTEIADATFRGLDSDTSDPSWVVQSVTYSVPGGGRCGASDGAALTGPPTSGFCNAGAFIDGDTTSAAGPWHWQCNVYQPDASTSPALATCHATLGAKCGPANGTIVSSAPGFGLCSIGAPSAVSGSGPWDWTCTQGTSTVACSAAMTSYTGYWIDGDCSVACGGGTINPPTCSVAGTCNPATEPSYGGACNTDACAVTYTGVWTPGSCSVTCGGGTIDPPTCSSPGTCDPALEPASGAACNTDACKVTYTGTWTPGSCSVACGGGTYGAATCSSPGTCDPAKDPTGTACNTDPCVVPSGCDGAGGCDVTGINNSLCESCIPNGFAIDSNTGCAQYRCKDGVLTSWPLMMCPFKVICN